LEKNNFCQDFNFSEKVFQKRNEKIFLKIKIKERNFFFSKFFCLKSFAFVGLLDLEKVLV